MEHGGLALTDSKPTLVPTRVSCIRPQAGRRARAAYTAGAGDLAATPKLGGGGGADVSGTDIVEGYPQNHFIPVAQITSRAVRWRIEGRGPRAEGRESRVEGRESKAEAGIPYR